MGSVSARCVHQFVIEITSSIKFQVSYQKCLFCQISVNALKNNRIKPPRLPITFNSSKFFFCSFLALFAIVVVVVGGVVAGTGGICRIFGIYIDTTPYTY